MFFVPENMHLEVNGVHNMLILHIVVHVNTLVPYANISIKISTRKSSHFRAMDRTLVLFLTLCREAEFELFAGVVDNV